MKTLLEHDLWKVYAMAVLGLIPFLSFQASGQERGPAGVSDAPSTSAPGSRVALVLGNAKYTEDPLKNPVNDATDMAKALSECGFHVFLGTDRDFKGMMAAVDQFTAAIPESGTALFYYAGHGIQLDGENYLVPLGAQLKVAADAAFVCVNVDQILRRIEAGQPSVKIVILDACRNSPFTRGLVQTRGGPSVGRGLATMAPVAGTFIAYATSPNQVAIDGEGRNGLFTAELLSRIRTPGLSIQDLFTEVRASLVERTKKGEGPSQLPWDSNSLLGKFYFLPGGGEVTPPIPSPKSVQKPEPVQSPMPTPPPLTSDESMSPREMYNLGKKYYWGEGVKTDGPEAIRWFRRAAEAGDISACYYLGWAYSTEYPRRGVSTDYAEAARCFRKGADAGDSQCMFYLGQMYEKGQGVPRSYADAVSWYRKASAAGWEDADKKLRDWRFKMYLD